MNKLFEQSFIRAGMALGVAVALSACTVTQSGGRVPARSPQAAAAPSVEGNWASRDGIAIATFQNGAFTNRAVDTGQPFTSGGRYNYTGGNQVAITYTSLVSNQQASVNCLVVAQGQMNCTNAKGAQFSLYRRA